MYPLIIIGNLQIHVFWLMMSFAWIVFFYLLHQFCLGKGITKHVFVNIVFFTVAIFLFSRIFYIFNEWRDQKFLFQNLLETRSLVSFLKDLLITKNYDLTLSGWIFGFFGAFWVLTQWKQKKYKEKYLDIIVPAFLFAGVIGYFGALLGGQIYGFSTDAFYGLYYTHKYSPIPFNQWTFPLPILYIFFIVGLLGLWYKISKLDTPDGYVGYLFMGIYGIGIFFLEFFSGSIGMLESYIFINFNQLIGIFLAIFSVIWLLKYLKK